jgi:hypothetical protein
MSESLDVNVSISELEIEMPNETEDKQINKIISVDGFTKILVEEEKEQEQEQEQEQDQEQEQEQDKENKQGLEKDLMVDIINVTLQKMFENFLQKNAEELKKVHINLSPELQKYFILFCQEHPDFFTDIENSLKAIIVDNTINSKDIPELLILMSNIYILIKDKKVRTNHLEGVDPYDIIETLMKIAVMLWVEKENKNYSVESVQLLVEQVMAIVKIAIKLMKLPIMEAVSKKSCFGCFGK